MLFLRFVFAIQYKFYGILVLVTGEVWMVGSVWQVRPGTQPGQKVVLKKKGEQVDIIYG